MFDVFGLAGKVHWQEYYYFLADGNPPLIFQLLILNTILLVIQVIRRARRKALIARPEIGRILQVLLIGANGLLMLNGDLHLF